MILFTFISFIFVTDALEIVLTHSKGVHSILNRKAITREVLFKYLHEHQVQVFENFTKLLLIERIIEYWSGTKPVDHNVDLNESVPSNNKQTEHFPINLMSREFSNWFFQNYNEDRLKLDDFWSDCTTSIRIVAGDINDTSSTGNNESLDMLTNLRRQLNIVFNPNLCHEGVQGRIDPHGLIVLMCCGTIHTPSHCVGLYETAFGLMKDPYNANNWRIKYLKLLIRSGSGEIKPKLTECDSLRQILALPESSDIL